MVEIGAPLDHITLAGHEHLWVVACRSGVPKALVEVDVSLDGAGLAAQLTAAAGPAEEQSGEQLSPTNAGLPMISVVVPSIVRRLDDLESCLLSLDALDYPQFEVIVADNRPVVPPDDPLPAIMARCRHVRAVRAPQPGISAARNAGVVAAKGEVVAFTDDDVRVERGWLRAFGARFAASPELDACTGVILPAELETPAQIYFERYYGGFAGERTFQPLTLQTGRGLLGRSQLTARSATGAVVRRAPVYGVGAYGAGANMAIRKTSLLALGGFDLALGTGTPARGGEDLGILIDILWAGGEMAYEPAAVIHHKHRRGYDELLQQLQASGAGLTATITSLVLRDPRHLQGVLLQVPLAAYRVVVQSVARLRGERAGGHTDEAAALYPPELVRRELSGMPLGPVAYLRSRRAALRWARSNGSSPSRALRPLQPESSVGATR